MLEDLNDEQLLNYCNKVKELLEDISNNIFYFPFYIMKAFQKKSHILFNLSSEVGECYNDIKALCYLMQTACWSQYCMIMRLAIERISKIIVLSQNQKLIERFIYIKREYCDYYKLDKKDKEKYDAKLEEKGINDSINYFEYGFAYPLFNKNKVDRIEILKKAGIEDFNKEIYPFYDKMGHDDLSMFHFFSNNRNMMIISLRLNYVFLFLFYKLYNATRRLLNINCLNHPIDKIYNKIEDFIIKLK